MADGEQAQVDWAHIGTIPVGAQDRPLYAFVMVLSASRALFIDVSFDMTSASVVRGHVRAFEHFGGVPRACLYDNMKTVVAERIGDVIRYHPRILELASHYHFAPRVCRPRRGNEKGRVERAIRYLRESFLAARVFTSLDDVRRQFAEWTQEVAERRPWPQDPTITVREAYERERLRLLPLPKSALDATEIRAVCAYKQPYIQVDTNRYSVPHEVVGKPITLELTHDELRFLDGERLLTTHARSWERRKVIEKPEHIETLKAFKRAAHPLTGRERLISEVPAVERLYAALADQNMLMAPQTRHLTLLLERFGASAVASAVEAALANGTPRAAAVERLLAGAARGKKAAEQSPLPLPKDPRALADVQISERHLHRRPHRPTYPPRRHPPNRGAIVAPQGGCGTRSLPHMSETKAEPEPSALQLLHMAMDHLSALLALLRSHHAALYRERGPDTSTEPARTESEDGVFFDDDIPF
jgi:uncharacterized coiled-coil protein SlyX